MLCYYRVALCHAASVVIGVHLVHREDAVRVATGRNERRILIPTEGRDLGTTLPPLRLLLSARLDLERSGEQDSWPTAGYVAGDAVDKALQLCQAHRAVGQVGEPVVLLTDEPVTLVENQEAKQRPVVANRVQDGVYHIRQVGGDPLLGGHHAEVVVGAVAVGHAAQLVSAAAPATTEKVRRC